ncbi:MAG: diguanylate cyclase (GGDEF)-like protein [Acidimicrobiales bacterium]
MKPTDGDAGDAVAAAFDVPGASGTGLQRWMARAPLSIVVVGLGIALSIFAWQGLRSVETSEARVAYERVLLAQSSELQVELQAYINGMDGLGAALEASRTARSVSATDNLFSDFEPLKDRQAISSIALFEIIRSAGEETALLGRERSYLTPGFADQYDGSPTTRPNVVLTRLFGVNQSTELLGQDLASIPALKALVDRSVYTDRTMVADTAASAQIFAAINGAGDASERSGLVLVAPIRWFDDAEERTIEDAVDGLLVGQLYLDQLLAAMNSMTSGEPAALELSADQQPLAATISKDERGAPFGEPVVFSEADVTWSIQGFEAGLEIDHRGSWVALFTGLLLAVTGGLFANSARRHAIILGRLERSEFDARHDVLTGLLNRAGLTEELDKRLADRRDKKYVSVLFLDLDRLKVVNDSIGHSAGDEVLKHVGRRLEGILRGPDIVGRFGGDEFVVVASGLQSITDAATLAERVLDAFREPATLSDESTQVISASIGISFEDGEDTTAESLLRDADLAMYRAKEAGGSRYEIFDSELRAQALARLEVERELRRAIRTGQLVVHYQPIVDVTTGMVDRLEALVRWQHPERGIVLPAQFLSVAAESGLIVDVGEHVLREACRQAALWQAAAGRSIMVSVNVAERQLLDNSLLASVKRVLEETGISPSQLELELTEELIVEKLDNRLTILRELVAMGVQLAIDDFGTSRASLSQLKSLDMVATLKIDRAFVTDVANDSVDRKIITAIVALADSVGMEVVAEGVEDADQVVALHELGVDLIQGFYFQRPAPSEQIIGLLRKPFEIPEGSVA